MKAQAIALALAGALIGASSVVAADVTPGGNADRARTDIDASQSRIEEGITHRNSPHPAVLSYERPVLPIGVPNPPVSLERY